MNLDLKLGKVKCEKIVARNWKFDWYHREECIDSEKAKRAIKILSCDGKILLKVLEKRRFRVKVVLYLRADEDAEKPDVSDSNGNSVSDESPLSDEQASLVFTHIFYGEDTIEAVEAKLREYANEHRILDSDSELQWSHGIDVVDYKEQIQTLSTDGKVSLEARELDDCPIAFF